MNNIFTSLVRADWQSPATLAGAVCFLCGETAPIATSCDAAGLRPVSPRQEDASSPNDHNLSTQFLNMKTNPFIPNSRARCLALLPSEFGLLFLAVLLMLVDSARAATHTWTGAMGDGRWSTAGNWSGGAPAAGEAAIVTLVFPVAGSKLSTNDIAGLTIDQIQISGDSYRIAGWGAGTNVTLRSGSALSSTFFITGAGAVLTNFNFMLSTNFIANASASVSPGDTATFRCRFTGPGGFIKRANGTLILDGNAANTYAGRTEVHGGTLQLSQGGNAIPGDLLVGLAGITNLAAVELLTPNQVADNAKVLVNHNGTFAPGVFSETIGSITISNADLVAGTGLTLNGAFTSIGTNTVTGTVLLGGSDRTFDVTGYLTANCFIGNASGFAGIIKAGPGTMEVQRTNSYNGITTVNAGTLCVAHTGGLGTAAVGTQVNDGATLQIKQNLTMPAEQLFLLGHGVNSNGALVLAGSTVLNGNIQLSTDAAINVPGANDLAVLSSQVTGAGALSKIGGGVLRLAGGTANSFTGGLYVDHGTVELAKPNGTAAVVGQLTVGSSTGMVAEAWLKLLAGNQIADSAPVTVEISGVLNLANFSDTIGAVELRTGRIETGSGTLALNGNLTATVTAVDSDPAINGHLSLGGATRTIAVDNGVDLKLNASIADGGASAGLIFADGHTTLTSPDNTYGGTTTIGDNAIVTFVHSAPGAPSGGLILENSALVEFTWCSITNESLNCLGDAWIILAGTNVWNGSVSVGGLVEMFDVQTNTLTSISGPISGPGGMKLVDSHVRLMGSQDNTIAGGFMVEAGMLGLNKSGGAVAVPNSLVIGTTNLAETAIVQLLANNQIDNSVVPSVRANGTLDLNGFNDSVGGLDLPGGTVETGFSGLLTLLGDITTRNPPLPGWFISSFISGHVSLGGAVRTFNVGSDGIPHTLNIAAELSDGGVAGGFKLIGPTNYGGSWLILQGVNSFSGPVTVCQGKLLAYNSGVFGTPDGGTTVSNGAAIGFGINVRVGAEPLSITGDGPLGEGALQSRSDSTNSWGGPITLGSASALITVKDAVGSTSFSTHATFVLDGPISGSTGLKIDALGKVIFAGSQSNSYGGATTIVRGDVRLAKTNVNAIPTHLFIESAPISRVTLERDNQIADSANVFLGSQAVWNVSNRVETVESFRGAGTINLGAGTLKITGSTDFLSSSYHFEGTMTGSGSGTNFAVLGNGKQILAGTNTYTGSTHLQGGSLIVNGQCPNTVIFITNNATLAGIGKVGGIVASGGTVSPGDGASVVRYGSFTALGNVMFKAGSKLRIELAGTSAGVNHDQFVAGGQFNLPGGVLETVLAAGTTTNDRFVVVKTLYNNAPAGTFAGLPEAQIFFPSPARAFQISYVGGDGNDITLTQLTAPQPVTMSGILKLGDGTIQLGGIGSPGLAYTVLASTNLASPNWVNLGSVTADGSGVFDFIDNDAPNFPARFYRFVLP